MPDAFLEDEYKEDENTQEHIERVADDPKEHFLAVI